MPINSKNEIDLTILFYSFLAVLILKGKYKGQNPIILVKMNIPARTSRMIPNKPVITLVKNNTTITIAIKILTTLSKVPMFFFMILWFKVYIYHCKDIKI